MRWAYVVGAAGLGAGVLMSSSCFSARSSQGGGQISKARAVEAKHSPPNPYDIDVPPGYRIEVVADDLTFPTGIAFGERGEIFVIESGYSYGDVTNTPRLLRVDNGKVRELATGDHAPWNGITYENGALFVAQGGDKEGGRIVRFDADGGAMKVLVDRLPSLGDHHTAAPAVHDGYVYFGQGTATNAAVVGKDNFDMGWLARQPAFHDVPCQDIKLTGTNFESENPLTNDKRKVTTGAYLPFGTPSTPQQVIKGQLPCNGAVMRVPVDGGKLELVAWGFRNPYGLAFDDSGQLYVNDNGYDVRGSRPVFGSADMMWRVEPGRWYGWPDYAEGRPLTSDFYKEDGGNPRGFLMYEHPGDPPRPVAFYPVHSSADGFDFSTNPAFGHVGWAFSALFGDMAPFVGKVLAPVGYTVVRVDPKTGDIAEFARNRGDAQGPSSKKRLRGFERPIAARFDPEGRALYVVDFGVLRMADKGPEPEVKTGRIWRITREDSHASR